MLPIILKEMREGASLIEVAAEIDISTETIAQWRNPESEFYIEEFSATIKKGVQLSQAWWHKMGRTNLKDKDFRDALWYMNMKNRFGWRDKHEEIDKPPLSPVVFVNEVPAPKPQSNQGETSPDDTTDSKSTTD
jgi:hypothetical protein